MNQRFSQTLLSLIFQGVPIHFPSIHDIPTFLTASIGQGTNQVYNERGQPGHEATYQLYYVVIFIGLRPQVRFHAILYSFRYNFLSN